MSLKTTLLPLISSLFVFANAYSQTPCAYDVSATMTPPPINCHYHAGDSVYICFNVGAFQQTSSNWIHGFVFDIGSGWDTSTLVVTQLPYSCSGNGNWGYYKKDSSYATDSVFGKGIYYGWNTQFVPADGIPGNNYGDENIGSCTWDFCIKIKVRKNCPADLHFGVRVTPDNLTGSGTNPIACTSPVIYSDSTCGADITSVCDTINSISNLKKLTLNLFPDPVASSLTIGPVTANLDNAKISIHAMDGRLINLPVNIKQSSGVGGMIYINTSNLPQGIYTLSLTNETLNLTSKFIVVRP